MPKYIYLIFFLLFSDCLLFAQTDTTSLFFYSDLEFSSSIEKDFFNSLQYNRELTYFSLSIYTKSEKPENYLTNYQTVYEGLINDLESLVANVQSPEKKIKIIHKHIQSVFLKKYEPQACFEDIFLSAKYNSVTATMLYALVLKHFSIQYYIKETIDRVFIIAMPADKKILIETTNPGKVLDIYYTDVFKELFIKYLKISKITANPEIQNKGIDSVFEKYFFSQTPIDMKQLIGLQYCNSGMFQFDNLNYINALNQFLKSYNLYPSKRTEYFIFNTLTMLISKTTYTDSCDWKNYILICRYPKSIFSNDILLDEFRRITSKLLIDRSNIQLYQNAYFYIFKNLKDTLLLKNISFEYHYESGRFYLVSDKWEDALYHYEQAYKINPDNYEVQQILLQCLFESLQKKLFTDEIIYKVERFYYSYKKLQDNAKMLDLIFNVYLYTANYYFSLSNWEEGNKYLLKFESLMDQHPGNNFYSYMISEVYKKPAAHYFKLYNNIEARKYILRGLKYSPNDPNLKNTLEMMK